ncbi:MAG: hypothetical protein ACREVS_20340 [Burkholderiales bacterium]
MKWLQKGNELMFGGTLRSLGFRVAHRMSQTGALARRRLQTFVKETEGFPRSARLTGS